MSDITTAITTPGPTEIVGKNQTIKETLSQHSIDQSKFSVQDRTLGPSSMSGLSQEEALAHARNRTL